MFLEMWWSRQLADSPDVDLDGLFSYMVRTWFVYGSYMVRTWFEPGSYKVRTRFV
jgi:hypothetical protein